MLGLEVERLHALIPDHLPVVADHDHARHLSPLSALELVLQAGSSVLTVHRGGSQLSERPALELAYALGADTEPAGDLAQARGLSIDAEARPQDRAFAIAEAAEQIAQLVCRDADQHSLVLILGQRIGDQLSEWADLPLRAGDWLLERLGGTVGGDQVGHLGLLQAGVVAEPRHGGGVPVAL